ncbi:MAG TPA: hypothetical protein VFX65_02255 [Candidatus Limnocylindrales bacterium]|nr:hypothetical protein [Candidatus Limnocylindrales bacterium]
MTTADPERLLGAEALGDALERLWAAVSPRKAVGGWGTVELDRAEVEVAAALAERHDLRDPRVKDAPDERLLGARCRLLRYDGDRDMLLLEPSTEGRLAAALARHGEGSLALYLVVDAGAADRARKAGFTVGSAGAGPLGPERLVVAGPRDGPFLLLAGLD